MFSPHAFPAADPNSDYVAGAQNELMVIVQIESRPGLESVEEIARVDGIDALLIGEPIEPCRCGMWSVLTRDQAHLI